MIAELTPLAERIGALLKARGQRIAVADGATGGLISAGLLTVPGATAFYVGGGVIYSRGGAETLLGIDRRAFAEMTPVSAPYAAMQAEAIRDRFGADWGIAESGSAGPGAHPRGIAAGTSCVAVAGPGGTVTGMTDTGDANRIRNMQAFALAALTLLHRTLAEAT
jgi:nicotinamide-nucleotide amidase